MRFGILSTANIAQGAVIPAIRASDHELVAIASRDRARANRVGERFDIPERYGEYASLFDADIDAVYNPLPNALHAEWTRNAADHGLHVLCEKPLTTDAASAAALFDYCADAGVTLMEAFMYRFHPRTKRAFEIVENELDDVRAATATFTFRLGDRPDDIRLSPELAGGSRMDVGCYAVSAVRGFLGEPERVSAHALDTRGCGVDTELVARLEYGNAHAQVRSGLDTRRREHYRVDAENGWLEAESVFVGTSEEPVSIEYSIDGRTATERFDPADPYRLEVEAFADAVESGSPHPVGREETIANMRVLDAIGESAVSGEPIPL
ncbi:Gfo/Idh/MocA family protein [Halovivax gelatinilyticus]|uniref:Gfo/Idh/MocA family protein n=1 Tax=Halovivax gelatinilyticus TaxID=2961597 RepID=UPI0020CA2AEC|nr:Gfo/Idh/MocA family oxidoreductase [Halovivax gelatinilyticus]